MWSANIFEDFVIVYINNIKHKFFIKNCRSVYVFRNYIYFLTDFFIIAYKNNSMIFKINSIENYCDKILVNEYIYVSGNDSGTMYKYNVNGKILESIKIGEHISDFFTVNNNIYVLSYFNNKLTVLNNFNITKKLYFSKFPQRILCNKYIYILFNDGFYNYIYMYSLKFTIIKKVKIKFQIGELFCFNNKLIYDGDDYRIIFNENLNIESIKKSTGFKLCKFSNYPICENNKILDVYNNIIYPI